MHGQMVGRVVGQTGIRSEGNLYGVEVLEQGDTSGVFGFLNKRNWNKAPCAYFSSALRAKTVK